MSTRRNFLQNAGLLTGGSVLASALGNESFAYFKNSIMPSDRVNIGVIGLNGMGWANAATAMRLPGVVIAALCDIDTTVIDGRIAESWRTTSNVDIASMADKVLSELDSVEKIELMLDFLREMGNSNAIAGSYFMCSVYLGEILKNSIGGEWVYVVGNKKIALKVKDEFISPE